MARSKAGFHIEGLNSTVFQTDRKHPSSLTTYKETLGQPIPVVIVKYPDPLGVLNTVQTASYSFLGTETDATQIVARRPDRNRLKLRTTVGEVFIASKSNEARSGLGFSVNVAAGLLDIETNDALWAWATAAATIYVLEEYTVAQGEALG